MQNENTSSQYPGDGGWNWPGQMPGEIVPRALPAGKPELIFALALLLGCIFLFNSLLAGGLNLGFTLGSLLVMGCSAGYLLSRGYRPDWYSASLLTLSGVIALGFARSADIFVEFILLCFMLVACNLGICLQAGRNRWSPAGISSLLDAPSTLVLRGCGSADAAGKGLIRALRQSGTFGKQGMAVALGLLIALPLMALLVTLLMFADAAFEGLLDLLPETNWMLHLMAVVLGTFSAWILYSRGVSLHREDTRTKPVSSFRGIPSLTVNTTLMGVCLVYLVYLFSQLAYFSGGFSGILPNGYTLAQYARRGFFEMGWLCAIDLAVIGMGVGLIRKQGKVPLLTRLLCLFIGFITVFFVATASAKMFLYIGSYGLTRLRVLTEVIMIWLGLVTVLVCLWLFLPKLPYMKVVLLLALSLGAAVIWTDVDTLVAHYNVRAYQAGILDHVDMDHLSRLGPGAVPYIAELLADEDEQVANTAHDILSSREDSVSDFRDWNYAEARAEQILTRERSGEADLNRAVLAEISNTIGLDVTGAKVCSFLDAYDGVRGDGQGMAALNLTNSQKENLQRTVLTDRHWHDLPLSDTARTLLYGQSREGYSAGPYLRDENGQPLLPEIQSGSWFFWIATA